MKLQLQRGSLRLRVSEAELAQLLKGALLRLDLVHGATRLFALDVQLHEASLADGAGFTLGVDDDARQWRLVLPTSVIADYSRTLPRRDALELLPSLRDDGTGPALAVLFEVDVRDSVRVRGPNGERPQL